MELKQHITIEIVKDKQIFTFNMPYGSTYGQAQDALFDMLAGILRLAQESANKIERLKHQDSETQDGNTNQ